MVKNKSEEEMISVKKASKENEDKYRAFFENANAAIIVADTETGIILDANKYAKKLLGRSREEIIGLNRSQIHLLNKKEYYDELFKGHVKAGGASLSEVEIVRKDGTRVPVQISASVMEINGKKVIQGIFHDITEKKKAEQLLRESEEKYKEIVENTNDIIITVDTNGIITYISPQVSKYIDLAPKEIISKSFAEFVIPEDLERVHSEFKETMMTGREFPTILRIKGKDSIVYSFEEIGKVQRDKNGNITSLKGVLRDITEREKTYQLLKESEEKFSKIFNMSPVIGVITTFNGAKFIDVNEAFEKATGYSKNEIIGKKESDFSMIAADIKKKTRENLKEKGFSVVETEVKLKSGIMKTGLFYASTITLNNELCIIQSVIDVTDKKRAEQDLLENQRKLENKNIALRELLSQIEIEKNDLKENIHRNMEKTVFPVLNKIKSKSKENKYIKLLEENLQSLTSPYAKIISSSRVALSPREIEICNLIKNGYKNKKIAKLLRITLDTVHTHRRTIRKKLDIKNKRINLCTTLQDQ